MARNVIGNVSLPIRPKTLVINGIRIIKDQPLAVTPHQATGMSKIKGVAIIPKAAGLKICWRSPVLMNCLESEAKREVTPIVQIGVDGSIISPINNPVTNAAEGN